jgi:hypothetical protein
LMRSKWTYMDTQVHSAVMHLRTRRLDFDTTNIRQMWCPTRTEGAIKTIKLWNMLKTDALHMKINLDNCWTLTVKHSIDMKVVRLQSLHLDRTSFRASTDKGGTIWSQLNTQMEACCQGRRTSPQSRELIKNWWRKERIGGSGIRNSFSHPAARHHSRHRLTSTHHFQLKIGKNRRHRLYSTPWAPKWHMAK